MAAHRFALLAGASLFLACALGGCGRFGNRFGGSFVQTQTLSKNVIQPGDGRTFPKPGDTLTMHYTGTLASTGVKFDSSRDRNQPFQFTIGTGQVIAGWDQGVMRMSLGERAILHIPSGLGYGAEGRPPKIPPNADLNFDVELLAINNQYRV